MRVQTVQKQSEIALQAGLWYNKPINIVAPAVLVAPRSWTNLLRRFVMDILPQDNTPRKQCTGPCGRTLPATPEYFHRSNRNKDGLIAQCKTCKNKILGDYKSTPEYQEYRKAYDKEYWQRKDVRERHRTRSQAWRHTPEGQIYYQNYNKIHGPILRSKPEKRVHQQAYNKAYYAENSEHIKANVKAYRSTPIGSARRHEAHHRRRARKASASGSHTVQDMLRIYKAQKCKCYWCDKKIKWTERHDDHIVPLSRGGSNAPDNMCVSCPTCNMSRRNKLPHEWTPEKIVWRLL